MTRLQLSLVWMVSYMFPNDRFWFFLKLLDRYLELCLIIYFIVYVYVMAYVWIRILSYYHGYGSPLSSSFNWLRRVLYEIE